MEEVEKKVILTTGRRKTAVARVRVYLGGKGIIKINGRDLENYFPSLAYQCLIKKPLSVTGMADKVDIKTKVEGGGISGQAGAISLGIARALVESDPNLRGILRKEALLTRDPRAKERKKYGRKGARRRFQWTKR
ncbi:MAG: 30S ribosomal protein S9 [Candidatus Omnitrophica bacterium 4484_70.1]|nr:MAG: 30S ribosomal protein S9 [Candidatus Omnitrophica bacterium 4484_70.1]